MIAEVTGWRLRRAGRRACTAIVCATLLACSAPPVDPVFATDRGLLEVVAELRDVRDADLYRFDPPTDVTGENLFRVALGRLDRFEQLNADADLAVPVACARGLAWERLGNFAAAASQYRVAAAEDSALGAKARADLPFTERMAELTAPVAERPAAPELLRALEGRRGELLAQLEQIGGDARRSLVEVEIERLDVRTREFYWRNRGVLGADNAFRFARSLIETHGESRRALEHMLRLGDMYAELAQSLLSATDPAGHEFDAGRFRELAYTAASIYAEVATVDGRPEREEARAKLVGIEALLDRAGGSTP